jgi:hypothetical protein
MTRLTPQKPVPFMCSWGLGMSAMWITRVACSLWLLPDLGDWNSTG